MHIYIILCKLNYEIIVHDRMYIITITTSTVCTSVKSYERLTCTFDAYIQCACGHIFQHPHSKLLLHLCLHNIYSNITFLSNALGHMCRWPFPLILCFVTIENDIVYNPMVKENIISRYVKVMQTLSLFSFRFKHMAVHFQL